MLCKHPHNAVMINFIISTEMYSHIIELVGMLFPEAMKDLKEE